jgi:surfeit locus 1 family protein
MTIPMLVALLFLGTWQVERYEWKADLITKLHERANATAIALPQRVESPESMEFVRVKVAGTFLNESEYHLIGRSMRGNPGLHILTPFRRADGGGVELVDRGWVSFDRRDAQTRPQGQLNGVVVVEGIIRLSKGQGRFMPDNEVDANTWFFIDPDAMAAARGIDSLPQYYISSGDVDVPGGFPIGRQWRLDIANNHREYAFTWFFMALALSVIYVIYHRQKPE